jgi:uncharacterized protein (DUF1800 family)
MLAVLLAACGGGGGGDTSPPPTPVVTPAKPADRNEAARFLTQATFGPTDADVARLMSIGYAAWIDEQLALPSASHRAHWEARDAELRAASPPSQAGEAQVYESFWKQAVNAPDQLRQRATYALSQIFVVSMADSGVANNPRAVAAWMDMLGQQGLGRYRDLLEAVARHPMMGVYLSHLRNQRADTRTGRVPDENFAREVMQLFSIGLVELNEDGSARTVGGQPVNTYTPADIAGLARVFTGWSWSCPHWPDNSCFLTGSANGDSDPDRSFKPMLGYPQYHSAEEKSFLGVTIAPQTLPDPPASLGVALDTIAAHPNVGPFIGRQLIQRLVTSNPSPAYVRDVARVFADNGAGVRGDLRAVLKAVLMHPDARVVSGTSGKLREPVLRLSAYLRAFPHASDTGHWRVGNTDNPATSLGQTPLRSPSVFNYYRPGYVPPGTQAAAAGLAVPEMQITHESSVAGYVNTMRDNILFGVGSSNGTVGGVVLNRRDIQADHGELLKLVSSPEALVDEVLRRLTYAEHAALRAEIVAAVASIVVPAPNVQGSNQAQIDAARRNRINTALLLTLVAPEFIVTP